MESRPIKVLFVDDDLIIGKAVGIALKGMGFDIHFQSSLTAIQSVISELKPNIIVLDVEIGEENGIDASKNIRSIFPYIPIIFISSHTDSAVAVRALENGGVNYLRKPFDCVELAAYINRHANSDDNNEIKFGAFTIDCNNRVLRNKNNDTKCDLNKKEYLLLKVLVDNINKVTPRDLIIKEVWGEDLGNDKSVNNYIARVRQCLSADSSIQIETISGTGYSLTEQTKK